MSRGPLLRRNHEEIDGLFVSAMALGLTLSAQADAGSACETVRTQDGIVDARVLHRVSEPEYVVYSHLGTPPTCAHADPKGSITRGS